MGGEKEDEAKFFKILKFHAPTFSKENSEVFLQNLNIEELELSYFTNNAKTFRFIDVKVTGKLTITHSTLTDMEFNGLDLSKCDKIIIKNSSFHNVLFNNVNWGEINSSRFLECEEDRENNIKKTPASRDTFRQLKFVNDSQGNHIQANEFYRMEMEAFGRDKKCGLFDKFIFLISKHLSCFSQNWTLPIFWYLNIGFILFLAPQIKNIDYPLIFLVVILTGILSFLKNDDKPLTFISILTFIAILVGIDSNLMAFEEYTTFINPFTIISSKTETYLQKLFVPHGIFKILSIFIGYHIYTSLHTKTRRK